MPNSIPTPRHASATDAPQGQPGSIDPAAKHRRLLASTRVHSARYASFVCDLPPLSYLGAVLKDVRSCALFCCIQGRPWGSLSIPSKYVRHPPTAVGYPPTEPGTSCSGAWSLWLNYVLSLWQGGGRERWCAGGRERGCGFKEGEGFGRTRPPTSELSFRADGHVRPKPGTWPHNFLGWQTREYVQNESTTSAFWGYNDMLHPPARDSNTRHLAKHNSHKYALARP